MGVRHRLAFGNEIKIEADSLEKAGQLKCRLKQLNGDSQSIRDLDRRNFFRLGAFLSLSDSEADLLSFIQRFVAAAYDVAEVNEYIRA